jgi:hypothetical protein
VSAGKTYLKCKCPHCGAEVSYPDYAGGGASSCGKCGKTVLLPRGAVALAPAPATALPSAQKPSPPPSPAAKPAVPPAPAKSAPASAPVKRVDPAAIRGADTPAPAARKGSFLRVCLWALNIAIVLAVVIVVGNHLKNRPKPGEGEGTANPPSSPAAPVPAAPTPKQGSSAPPAPANPPTAKSTAPPPAPTMTPAVTPKGPKLIGDLKVTQVALDQPKGAKGSRLVYVTGVLKNESDHQRFGVRVELDLLDATTNKVGTATDYRQMLEPRATWQFRALVTDRRTVGARLAGVKEDE